MSPTKRIYREIPFILLIFLSVSITLDAIKSLHASGSTSSSATSLSPSITPSQTALLQQSLVPLHNLHDYDILIKLAGQKPLVLIGDSTHGTHEFYQQRINISKRLIQEKNFKAIFLEGDWPNVYTLNQYVQSSISITAKQALDVFNPHAAWLWNNEEMLGFIQWLKNHNEQLPTEEQKVSIHGLDIYSFDQSRALVIDYLQNFSPQAAQQARLRYQCFNRFNNNLPRYGQAVSQNPSLSCEAGVLNQYLDFAHCRIPCPEQYPLIEAKAFFYAQQNARIVKNIEKSSRIQYMTNDPETAFWNQRDQHMMESFLALSAHLKEPKAIIWAHSSHLGDARATEMTEDALLNLGQLLRQHFKQEIFAIGMLTYSGKVMAADSWNTPAKVKTLLAAQPNSNLALFHHLGIPNFVLDLHQSKELTQLLNQPRLQRHVGVIYKPQEEMSSHYSYTRLADQFDAVVYTDDTSAVIPLKNKE